VNGAHKDPGVEYLATWLFNLVMLAEVNPIWGPMRVEGASKAVRLDTKNLVQK